MIDWKQILADEADRKAKREGYRATEYTGEKCKNCGRNRVMRCDNLRLICEKCGWDQVADTYSDYLDSTI